MELKEVIGMQRGITSNAFLGCRHAPTIRSTISTPSASWGGSSLVPFHEIHVDLKSQTNRRNFCLLKLTMKSTEKGAVGLDRSLLLVKVARAWKCSCGTWV